MNIHTKKIIKVFALALSFLPVFVFAAGLVPCQDDCTFLKIFELITNIINFFIKIAVPLCALAITWGGIQLVLNPTNATAKGKAKEIIVAAGLGLAIALGSYLIVNTLLTLFSTESIDTLQP